MRFVLVGDGFPVVQTLELLLSYEGGLVGIKLAEESIAPVPIFMEKQ